jgi:hypothetical protein
MMTEQEELEYLRLKKRKASLTQQNTESGRAVAPTLSPERVQELRAEQQNIPTSKPSIGAQRFYTTGQGATFNLGDEIAGAVGAAREFARTGSTQAAGQAYKDVSRFANQAVNTAFNERPIESTALTIAGGLPYGSATKLTAGTTGKTARQLAGQSAIIGGLYGAGSGEGTDRLINAGTGAATGAALGFAAPYVVKGVQGAGKMTGRAIGSIQKAREIDLQVAKELADQGIDVSLLTAGKQGSGSDFVRGYLRNTFVGGEMVRGAGMRTQQQVLDAAEKAISNVGKAKDAATAGENLIKGLDTAKKAFQSKASKLYNYADSLMPNGFVKVSNLKKALTDTPDTLKDLSMAKVLRSPETGKLADDFVAALSEAQSKGKVDYNFLKSMRTEVGRLIDETSFAAPEQRFWRKTYGALSKDMEEVAKSAGTEAFQAVKDANVFYRTGRTELEKQMLRFGGKKEAEDVFKAVASTDMLKNAPQKVVKLFNRIPNNSDKKVIGATIIKRLGLKTDGGNEFDLLTFANKWENIATTAKNAISGGAQNAKSLDMLVRNIRRVQPLIESIPATGQVAAGRGSDIAAAASFFYSPALGAAKFMFDAGLGSLLTSPMNVNKLNNAFIQAGNAAKTGNTAGLMNSIKQVVQMLPNQQAKDAVIKQANDVVNKIKNSGKPIKTSFDKKPLQK